jgi:hypothetical protein
LSDKFKPHSEKQRLALKSNRKILVLGCGTQFGKTTVGAVRMKIANHKHTQKDDNFIITSPTYKTLTQSTLPAYLKLMEDCGKYNKVDQMFEIDGGGKVFFRTETDPDSIVGITNVRHIWGDEAGKYRLYFWENMQARSEFLDCPIDLTTSPYSLNWIYKDLIKPARAGMRKDVDLIQAASWENPFHSLYDPDKREEKRATMDERRFNMIYGGEWHKVEGLVYDCWDDDENYIEPFNLPNGTKFYAGVDWGFTDPFVLKVRAITPDGRHYGVSEFYKTGMTLSDMLDVAYQKRQIFPIQCFYCDPSQPGHIEEFNRNHLPAIGADNNIEHGIRLHYDLIKSRRYKEFIGMCPHSTDEREVYHYPEFNEKDLKPDESVSKKMLTPVDAQNHAMDCDRYISIMTYHSAGDERLPKTRKRIKTRLDELKAADRPKTWEKVG